MNGDLMYNGTDSENPYTAGEELWSEVADYDGRLPLFSSLISYYISKFGVLGIWTLIAFLFARRSTLKIDDFESIR